MYFDHDSIVPPNPIIFSFGPLTLRWYGLLIVTGVFLAVFVSGRECKKKGIDPELPIELAGIGMPICIIGARLYFILFNNLGYYLQNPGRIFAITEGGLAIHGGIIAAFLFGRWYLKRKNVPFLPMLDIASVGFFIGQMLGRFGNFMNQEAFGRAINAPTLDAQREFLTGLFIPEFIVNGMFIRGSYHHPTFLYEVLWNTVGLLIAVFILRRLSKLLVGEIAAFYAIWYSAGRFFIEALRTDSLMLGPFRVAQVISVATVVAVSGFVVARRKKEKEMVFYATFNLVAYNKEKLRREKKAQKLKKKGRA